MYYSYCQLVILRVHYNCIVLIMSHYSYHIFTVSSSYCLGVVLVVIAGITAIFCNG